MKKRTVPIFAIAMVVGPSLVAGGMGNGISTVIQDAVSAGGNKVGDGNPLSVQTVLGLPAGGKASNVAYTLIGGMGSLPTEAPPIATTITVTGTVNDPAAAVIVNGTSAVVSGATFTAAGVPLVLGPNTLTAVATDSLGNTTTRSIRVYLDVPAAQKTPRFSITVAGTINDSAATVAVNSIPATVASGQFSALVPLVTGVNTLTASATDPLGNAATTVIHVFVPLPPRPPAKPTVGTVGPALPVVTTSTSITVSGTKTAGTSIWINGTQVVGLNNDTTWTVTVSLVEGDNVFSVVTKDGSGVASAPAVVNVIVDNLAPVISSTPPAKTNVNPFLFTGTVDDSLTVVKVNGIIAARSGRSFEVSIPLSLGANTVTVTATSPNGYGATKSLTISRGTIPAIQSAQPADGAKTYAGAVLAIQITATDQESDPIQYQVLVDGLVLNPWSTSASQTWTPGSGQAGLHTMTMQVRDAYGGSNGKDLEVFVVRPPIQHP